MSKQKSLPTGQLKRLSKFGGLVSNVLGNMAIDGVKELSKGRLPALKDLMLTPQNIANLAERLAQLRGAAMKMGQVLSMDAGDLLPPELAEVLAMLRDNAYVLPDDQLNTALTEYLGEHWESLFATFEKTPFAAASIGQVHKAILHSGEIVAVKLQYPGVAKSIHSDVDNMGVLIKMSGLVPENLDMTRVLLEVKMQLIRESDYTIEAAFLKRYQELLLTSDDFVIPRIFPELSNSHILTMSLESGESIDTITSLPECERKKVCESLVHLLFREMFEFRLMQTDPNFANFMYDESRQKIVLLDFGATREISEDISEQYKLVAKAILNNDMQRVVEIASELGFFIQDFPASFRKQVVDIMQIAAEPMQHDGDFDFGATNVITKLREEAMPLLSQRKYMGTPPGDALFMHRKIGGVFLLMMRAKVKLNLRAILEHYIQN
ncbi:MAG: AarF/ABC1/UbiB kinase family protein [Alteromonadaceae bacterium]|nr:AarF/ABC1/UbiB kinase family protein [Alteromonadaceae bacterium]